MKTIEIKYKGIKHSIILDDSDYENIKQYSCYFHKCANVNYADVYVNRKKIKLHRFVMNAKKGQIIDHINRNGLDNRRSNLRICTSSENSKNRNGYGSSKYLGVSYHVVKRKYFSKKLKRESRYTYRTIIANIKIDGKQKYLGTFKTEEDAALAYNESAKINHGEFANLNVF